MINPLNPLLGKIEKYNQQDCAAKQWESKRVEWTLTRLGLAKQKKEILYASEDKLYSFKAFNTLGFPMELCADAMTGHMPIHKDPKSIHPAWFKSFANLHFAKLFNEALDEFVEKKTKPMGMIFPRKGFSQGLIMHNGDWETFLPPHSSCHLFRGDKMNFVVQPYTDFIDHVRDGLAWKIS